VHELEKAWPQMLDEAAEKAAETGRNELAAYLRLKATNDAVRTIAVGWLIDSFVELAGEAMRGRPNLLVEREEPHSFKRGNSRMVGTLIEVKQGVRRVGLAAGWARVPADGIMEKGALAYARFTHFGMPEAGTELRLVQGDDLPTWLDESDVAIDLSELQRHLDILLS
jgi:hypothetical protein